MVEPEEVFVAGTHVKVKAIKNKCMQALVKVERRTFTELFESEINQQHLEEGMKPLKKEQTEMKAVSKSTVDSDAGLFYNSER